jgi:hypothetical protein
MEFTYFDMILVMVWTVVLAFPLAMITIKTCEFIDAYAANRREVAKTQIK